MQITQFIVGYAVDPEKRLIVHNSGKGAKYTRARLPAQLVYYEKHQSKSEALHREIELKKLTRAKKENMIENFKLVTIQTYIKKSRAVKIEN